MLTLSAVEIGDCWICDVTSDAVLVGLPFSVLTMVDRHYSSTGLACASVALRRGR